MKKLFSFIVFTLISIVVSANGKNVTEQEISDWVKSLITANDYRYHVNILNFPKGELSSDVWRDNVLPLLKSPNEQVRFASAYIIGIKKLYPNISIPALIETFSDIDYNVTINAVFSLNAFGRKTIPSLLNILKKKPKPWAIVEQLQLGYVGRLDTEYVNKHFDRRYIPVTAFLQLQPSMQPNEHVSIPAVWSLLTLRNMRNEVLPYLKLPTGIDSNYVFNMLECMDVNIDNCVQFYNILKSVRIDSEHNYKLIYQKLGLKDLRLARRIILKMDSNLLPEFDVFIEEKSDRGNTIIDRGDIDTSLLQHTTSNTLILYKKLSNASIDNKLSSDVVDSVILQLNAKNNDAEFEKSDLNKKMLLLLIANIRSVDEAFQNALIQCEKSGDTDLRYLAIKARINSQLRWTNGYEQLSRIFSEQEPNKFKSYFEKVVNTMLTDSSYTLGGYNVGDDEVFHYGDYYRDYLDTSLNKIKDDHRIFFLKNNQAVQPILSYIGDRDLRVRLFAIMTLSKIADLPSNATPSIIKALQDSSYVIRKIACEMLVHTGSPDSVEKYVTTFLMTSFFKEKIITDENHLRFNNDVPPYIYGTEGNPLEQFPSFPDKVPRPSAIGLLRWGNTNSSPTIMDVYKALRNDLIFNKYSDLATFSFQDGFALQTSIERMKKNGTIDYEHRYSRSSPAPKSISDYFILLFIGDEGFFRGLTFIVTSKPSIQPFSMGSLGTTTDYGYLFAKGEGAFLASTTISESKLNGKFIHMLVYEYGKSSDGVIRINHDDKSKSFGEHFIATKMKSFSIR